MQYKAELGKYLISFIKEYPNLIIQIKNRTSLEL